MDHGAAGEIEDTQIAEEGTGTGPGHVADGGIDQQRPCRHEDHHGRKLHAFGKGPHHQGRRDDGKGHLKGEKHTFRNGAAQAVSGNAAGKGLGQASNERMDVGHSRLHAGGVESQAVAEQDPEYGDQAGHGKALHQH